MRRPRAPLVLRRNALTRSLPFYTLIALLFIHILERRVSRRRQAGGGPVVQEEGVDGAREVLNNNGAARRQRRGDGAEQALRQEFRHLPAISRLSELRNLKPVTCGSPAVTLDERQARAASLTESDQA